MARLDDPFGDYPDDPPDPVFRWWHYALAGAVLLAGAALVSWVTG